MNTDPRLHDSYEGRFIEAERLVRREGQLEIARTTQLPTNGYSRYVEDEDAKHSSPIELEGGQVTKVIRIGDKVQRPRRSWTPFVHRLLRHLEEVGFDAAPRVLRIEEEFEVLSYISGEAGYFPLDGSEDVQPPNLWSDAVLVEAAALLRKFHSAQTALNPLAEPGWNTQRVNLPQRFRSVELHIPRRLPRGRY